MNHYCKFSSIGYAHARRRADPHFSYFEDDEQALKRYYKDSIGSFG